MSIPEFVDACVASKEEDMHCRSASVVGEAVVPSSDVVVRDVRQV